MLPANSAKIRLAAAYDNYADMLYRIAYSQLHSREDAEDAVQDVFSGYMSGDPFFESESHMRAWFIRSVINRCHDLQRRNSLRAHDSIDDHVDIAAEDEPEKTLAEDVLFQKLGQLPEKIRRAVTLHYLEGFSVEETAKILEISVSSVKMRLMRGRALFRRIEENDNVL